MVELSIVIPTYNEEKKIEKSIKLISLVLRNKDYEIIVVDDGSLDKTAEIASSLSEGCNVRVLQKKDRCGRGYALKKAFPLATGEIVGYMDADMATSPQHILELKKYFNQGYDIVIGSRYVKGSKAKRTFLRLVLSKTYNFLIKMLFNSKINDYQCGFKFFKKEVLPLVNEIKNNKWFFDTEFLIYAQKKGLKIKELPVKWDEQKDTKVNLSKDPMEMIKEILKLKFHKI